MSWRYSTSNPVDHDWQGTKDRHAAGEKLWSCAHAIAHHTKDRELMIRRAFALYGESSAWPGSSSLTKQVTTSGHAAYNVIAGAVDSFVSEITQSTPRPEAVSTYTDWDDIVATRLLTAHWDHLFEVEDVEASVHAVARDGAVFGRGFLRPYIDWQRQEVKFERLFPGHVLIDDRGLIDPGVQHPTRYMWRAVPRELLREMVRHLPGTSRDVRKAALDAINGAPLPDSTFFLADRDARDICGVVYGWDVVRHRYVVAVKGYAIDLGDYPHDTFPMADFAPLPAQAGGWGESMTMRAAKTQLELNKLLTRIRDAQHAHGRVILTIPEDASRMASQILNDVATIVPVPRGGSIGHVAVPSMPGDIYQWTETLVQRIYAEFGQTAMSVNGEIPTGFRSGIAITRYRELTSRRHRNAEVALGRAVCQLARLSTRMYRELAEHDADVEVIYQRYGGTHRIPWRKLDLDDSRMRVRVMATNAIPRSPAARLEYLQNMLEMQVITPEQFLDEMDYPDLEGVRAHVTAPRRYLQHAFESMLESGEYSPPIPEAPLSRGIAMASTYILQAEMAGAPESRTGLLRRWIKEAEALQRHMAKAAAPPPGAGAPMPGAGPMTGGPMAPPAGPDAMGAGPIDPAAVQAVDLAMAGAGG